MIDLHSQLIKNADFLTRETVKGANALFTQAEKEAVPKDAVLSGISSPGLTLDKLHNQMRDVVRGQIPLKSVTGIGSYIMRRTTWSWVSIPRGSRSRAIEQVCKFAILEHCRVRKYRRKVLSSSTAHLRHRLQKAIADTTDSVTVDGKAVYVWSFSDRLECPDLSKVEELTPGTVASQRSKIRMQNLIPQHKKEFAAIRKVIEESSIVTHSGSLSGGMEHNVWLLYDQFLAVSEKIGMVVSLLTAQYS